MIALWGFGGDSGWNSSPDGFWRQWALKTWRLMSDSPFLKGNLRGWIGRPAAPTCAACPCWHARAWRITNTQWHQSFLALISLVIWFLRNVKTAKYFKALTWIVANIKGTKWTKSSLSVWLKKNLFIGAAIIAGRSAYSFIWRIDWEVRCDSLVLRLNSFS